ncbi:rod shape-determining protein MreC [Schleiferia thermophila]|uniref:Cell shape-determining protein MreC n=1 Tax=Schleiferia thermophila TaxID=884107 RepID=A0A369A7D3_9FLAO|nr:rod shape-determining protein MreC [Schleiferia thermophila]RCX05063.1 rod shape-determining protein MreC [Schleiferia thermophila]GCD79419.1 rod shape-determining protein MreC [Schleiferia thermophila]
MNKVWSFLIKNAYLILFILIQGFCLSLTIRHNVYQNYVWFTSSTYAVGTIHDRISAAYEYLSLKQQNQVLQTENAVLRTALEEFRNSFIYESGRIEDTLLKQVYTYQEARVIHSTIHLQNNYLVIDKGEIHGLKPGMAVISPIGVAGIIKDVGSRYSTALSVIHSKFSISARPANAKNFGSLIWNGKNYRYAQLIDLPRQTRIRNGDTVVTDVRSLIFPEGIGVGIIKSYRTREPGDFIEAQIELFTDFSSIHQVYVIDFIDKKAIEDLKLLINEGK